MKSRDFFNQFWEGIKHRSENVDLDTLASSFKDRIHAIIRDRQQQQRLTYKDGRFKISYQTDTTFLLKYALYFQNEQEEWVIEEAKTTNTMYCLTKQAIEELCQEKEIVYDISLPEKMEVSKAEAVEGHETASVNVSQEEKKTSDTPFQE